MFRVCWGRADIDKDRFLFDRIGESLAALGRQAGKRVLLVVPDQYTLQAERNAFAYMKTDGLMELEVLSQARLGEKVLAETGTSAETPVDKYGRHMLLARIVAEEEREFGAFGGMGKNHAFISMVNDLISEFKQYNAKPDDIRRILESLDQNTILCRKLNDIHRIYSKYESLIRGKYIDTEDHLDLINANAGRSNLIAGADIWIDGFDHFTPKTLALIEQLVRSSCQVNIIMTYDRTEADADLFALPGRMLDRFRELAARNGERLIEESIGPEYAFAAGSGTLERDPAIRHIERELYAYPYRRFRDGDSGRAIDFCRCGSYYAEAETAAARIDVLVRENGMRFRDILVICNDIDGRGSIVRRVFEEYGIPCFIDRKRSIVHNPCVEYILAFLDIIGRGWRFEDVFRLIKTGLAPVLPEDGEDIENYAYKYRIRGSRWKSAFRFGAVELGEDGLAALNVSREAIAGLISDFEAEFRTQKTAGGKTEALYDFLRDTAQIPARAESLTEFLRHIGRHEYAEETAQIWSVIVGILDQVKALAGDEPMSGEEYGAMLRTGLEAVEIGLLPPTMDQVLVGTMQRTRPGAVKALFVIGANDGVLPAATAAEGILNEDEKALLLGKSIEICKHDDLRAQEEKLAIYRMLSKPAKKLWIGYSAADPEGKELKPSLILGKLRKIFPDIIESKDIISLRDPLLMIGSRNGTLRHLSEELREGFEAGEVASEWKAAYRWFFEQSGLDGRSDARPIAERLRVIKAGMTFDNKVEKLGAELVRDLYGRGEDRQISVSPSRIERFSKCPFAYFINYGLRADERRIFEIAGREIGDICHECLMKLGNELTVEGIGTTDPDSPWMTVSESGCEAMVGRILGESAADYREGVFDVGEAEKYRQERVRKICVKTAWILIGHVRKGNIRKMLFEAEFGRGALSGLPPVQIRTAEGDVLIEGKIDRIDILGGEQPHLKIIDYKSGSERFNAGEARAGWRLQLMLYLKAATDGLSAKPAGVFYFFIDDPMVDAALPASAPEDKIKAAVAGLAGQIRKKFRMDGILVDEPGVVADIDRDFSGYSDIVPIRRKDDGSLAGSDNRLISPEEFTAFQQEVEQTGSTVCSRLMQGIIDIAPKKLKNGTSACTYCQYRSICNFDLAFEGCRYETI